MGTQLGIGHMYPKYLNSDARSCSQNPIIKSGFHTIIVKRAQGVEIGDLLKATNTGNKKRETPAVPPKFPPENEVLEKLKNLAMQDEEHQLWTFLQIAQEAGVKAASLTIYRIMHKYHGLYRYCLRHKPILDANTMEKCLRLVNWALAQLIESFVYSDEMILEVGTPWSRKKITRQTGEDPYQLLIHNNKKGNGFSIMISASISLGYKGPIWIWVKETPEERRENAKKLQQENIRTAERVAQLLANATIPGTLEYNYIQALNHEIDHYNEYYGPNNSCRLCRHPYWEFGKETHMRSTDGGMDWFMYRKHVLQDQVYPFITQIQQEMGRQCWLAEDNAGNHTAAARMDHQAEVLGVR
ncbi:hypothetical protein C7212DRAFT_347335 [Tuber magnatum]|uniref:Transposase n=1 Tax=Tuber magnatum TaxID=42249 RepID=A0A317SG52_9PEZI|nr:hypothetical protein C7212DRAFT_347335 [Tuber magnatum]